MDAVGKNSSVSDARADRVRVGFLRSDRCHVASSPAVPWSPPWSPHVRSDPLNACAAATTSSSPDKVSPVTLRHVALVALLVCISNVQADIPWRSVREAELRGLFIDHELADGVHYAYQFRGDGTFSGFTMGKEIHGTWRSAGNEFCWMQRKSTAQEECFEVERRGNEIRFLRDGYEAFSGRLSSVKSQAAKDTPR